MKQEEKSEDHESHDDSSFGHFMEIHLTVIEVFQVRNKAVDRSSIRPPKKSLWESVHYFIWIEEASVSDV